MSALLRLASMLLLAACLLSPAAAQTTPPEGTGVEGDPPAGEALPGLPPVPPRVSTGPATPIPPVESATLPRDLSPWGMIVGADPVVQAVMAGLAFASVLTWTIWLAKSLEIAGARVTTRTALRLLDHVRSLDEAAYAFSRRRDPPARLVTAALQETQRSADLVGDRGVDGVKERIAARLARIEAAAGRRLMRGTGVLASIGATAPFVGLFGTVWGIMNAFIGISEAETTNLAVVAPGIAEALLATAFGLIAAIPAVVIYNLFARAIASYRASLADAAASVLLLSSRDLDRGAASAGAAAE